MPFILLLGGARSGKSALAVELAIRSGAPVTVLATGEAGDPEMAERIARHQAERPPGWRTVEEPVALLDAVRTAPATDLLLVDCLTLWVSNVLTRDAPVAAGAAVAEALAERPARSIVVSNEVGLGIVPANELARRFRDALGAVNAAFAARAERVALLVAGRVLELPPAPGFLEDMDWGWTRL